ncbi:hypothetical protein M8C21_023190 [Ambrosia artemisiifolia]|uniref:Uncharacterized protein n=1 Tax=Ambrosia artemisiifolia TaxID=4212 RepID=A0AAD5CPF0_AMBAR|nr:hypothetical protein M8C21_023190 [Ambrosia artemisiifolia]
MSTSSVGDKSVALSSSVEDIYNTAEMSKSSVGDKSVALTSSLVEG